jgi:MFS family permease
VGDLVPVRPQARRPSPRALVWTLGLGAFGLAFSITTTAAYLPPFLSKFTNSGSLIGLILGSEGIFALTLPLVIGPWSDTFYTPLGRRRPFMLAALGPMCFCLTLMAFMPTLWLTTLVVLAFFGAYYVYETPYRGLYPDLLPEDAYGRSQSVQHVLRGAALGLALIGGGFLFKAWHPAPFLIAAFVTTCACGAVIVLTTEDGGHARTFLGVRRYLWTSWRILRDEPQVRGFLLANAAWEGAFAAARTFVVLYITRGLGQPIATSSAVLGTVAAGYVVAAVVAGPLGDRFGLACVIYYASFVYGGGFILGGLAQRWHDYFYGLIFPVAVAGGMVMTLAWGLLFKLMPARHRGATAGLATWTKGFGLIVGAPLAGGLIDLSSRWLPATHGYEVLWPICGVPVLVAIPAVYRLKQAERGEPMSPNPQSRPSTT